MLEHNPLSHLDTSVTSFESQEQKKQKIVENILNNKKDHFENSAYIVLYSAELRNGGKKMDLAIDVGHQQITTQIENIPEATHLKKPDDSSLLYEAAYQLMQEQVNILNTPMTYTFKTRYKKLKAWAESKGKAIFEWEDVQLGEQKYPETNELDSYESTFIKKIFPHQNNLQN